MAGFWKKNFGFEGVKEKLVGCFLVYLLQGVFVIKNRGMCDNLKNALLPYLLVKNGYIEKVPAVSLQNTLLIADTREIVQVLNDPYINIVERFWGEKLTSVAKYSLLTDDI